MGTFNSRELQNLFVGGTAGDATAAIGAMPNGEIGIFTPAGARITEASAVGQERFIIVQSRGTNPPLQSPVIDKTKVNFKAGVRAYVAPTVQISAIGFNGTSGAIEAINDNLYMLDINVGQELVGNHGGLYIKHGVYQSGAAASQAGIATGLAKSVITNFSREPQEILYPEVLLDEAGAGLAGAVTTVSFTNGSKVAVANNAVTLAVGDYLRVTAGVGNAVYRVAKLTPGAGTTVLIEFEYPYQGATATAAVATVFRITEAQADAADAGVRLTGFTPNFVVGKFRHRVYRWVNTLKDFGTTTVSELQTANLGTGSENQIAELEWFTQGNEGDFVRMGEPTIFPARRDANTNYDLLHISTEQIATTSVVSGPIKMEMTLAIPVATPDYADGGTADDITDVLEVLIFGAVNGNLTL